MHSYQSVISIWCYLNNLKFSLDYRYNFQLMFVFLGVSQNINWDSIKILHFALYKIDRNYNRVFLPAIYIEKAYEQFNKYSK